MRPHLLLTAQPVEGLRSVDDIRRNIRAGYSRQLWERLLRDAKADRSAAPLTPRSMLPDRAAQHAETGNRDYHIVAAAGARIARGALIALITDDRQYLDPALSQLTSLFDESDWPDWRDLAHLYAHSDLRTGMLGQSIGLAYDWAHGLLTDEQRRRIVEGLDRCAIQPYLRSVEAGDWFTVIKPGHMNNWHTVVVGGMGVAGMALGADHPQSQTLIDHANQLMDAYWQVFGEEGEFNESPGYANAIGKPVEYWTCHRYHTQGASNRLAQPPLPQACDWLLHQYLPPGRVAAYGDTHVEAVPRWSFFAPMADATRNGVLQAVFEHLSALGAWADTTIGDLLHYNPELAATSPEGRAPLGRAFHGHSGCITSRTSWDLHTTDSVVYGKAGHGREGHGNHDAGQLCIDAHAERLITDPGVLHYPPDFFGANRYRYYNASCLGHNVLMFDAAEMRTGEEHKARIVASEFDDARGGWWTIDLTDMYDNVRRVRRTVVHLTPGTVAVLDEAMLLGERAISLRWHTINKAQPDAQGRFIARTERAQAVARVVRLDEGALRFTRREHAYAPPYDKDRLGYPLEQKHESYVDVMLRGGRCRLLSLFQTGRADEPISPWEAQDGGYHIDTPDGPRTVTVSADDIALTDTSAQRAWRIALPALLDK